MSTTSLAPRRSRRIALAAAAVLLAACGVAQAASTPSAGAAPKPLTLLVHGIKPLNYSSSVNDGTDCGSYWQSAKALLAPADDVRTVGFYTNDVNCDVPLTVLDDNGAPMSSVTINTRIDLVGKALANAVYAFNVANPGTPVRLGGHSMGGLVIYEALHSTALHRPGYPPFMSVTSVVTMESPLGAMRPQINAVCQGVQCDEFKANASAEPYTLTAGTWLHDRLGFNTTCASAGGTATNRPPVPSGLGPSGTGTTKWASLGSQWDTAVSSCSATSIQASPTQVLPLSMMVNHNEVLTNSTALNFFVTNLRR